MSTEAFPLLASRLAELGRTAYARGWTLGTSGNFSAVVTRDPLLLAITPSGVDKGLLTAEQILRIDGSGAVVEGTGRPSAETGLHLVIVRARGAGAVAHTHSVWSTMLSEAHAGRGGVAIEGYEMLKGLRGVATHEHREWLPIIENSQDWEVDAREVEEMLARHPETHGFLIRRHGLYTWGEDLAEAKRHVEVLEFLLEVVGRSAQARRDETMAVLRIPDEKRTLSDPEEVTRYLAGLSIQYERWEPAHPVAPEAPAEQVLEAYAPEIERLKSIGGYVTADVIDVRPQTPGLEAMLAKFNREHWHDEDEVRFIIEGRGLFHIRPREGPVVALEVAAGDLIRVPRGTWHWFDLCADQRIRAIRLFQDPSGWTPHYTDSGVDRAYEPVCFGPAYLPPLIA